MKVVEYPPIENWQALATRPTFDKVQLKQQVQTILSEVKQNGDDALYNFTKKFDGAELDALIASENEIENAVEATPAKLKQAIQIAKQNIERFHLTQTEPTLKTETMAGVQCWRKSVPIEKVGLYIPGGTAPLFSTILMLGIPAKIAGCKEIVLCTPPNKEGKIADAILYTANLLGITNIHKIGGAQAIAAMAFGTKTVPQVYKIFGPGNQYVTEAKAQVQQNGNVCVAIDMPAGPSEVLVIADESCNPAFVAADLLSQAEHGTDSQVLLLSDSKSVIEQVLEQCKTQLENLPRKAIATKALENSKAILLNNWETCIAFSNAYAPEHLIIASTQYQKYEDKIINAGSVFLGNYSCESAGDYASGTNHTLPTNGYAKNYSGVSLDSFVKKITFQHLSKTGLQNIGKAIEIMAAAEDLMAHKNAVTLRLNAIKNV